MAFKSRQSWERAQLVVRSGSGKVGLGIMLVILSVVVLGPLVAPHAINASIDEPYTGLAKGTLFGTDFLGRDVLSRVLAGGQTVILLAGVATLAAYAVGGVIGLAAGYSRSFLDPLLMRAMDVVLAFPPILLLLLLATGGGASETMLVAGVATIHVAPVARIVRAASLEVSVRGYVEAAIARGESAASVIFREILPNITGPIAADAGPRLTISILLVAAANFLGLGVQPPTADWALMIAENRPGIAIQPWAVAVPAFLIAALTMGINLLADAFARSQGVSADDTLIRR